MDYTSLSAHHNLNTSVCHHTGPVPPPPELTAAWQSLQKVMACCSRTSRAATRGHEAEEAQQLWFKVMEYYIQRLRAVHQQQQGAALTQERTNHHQQDQQQGNGQVQLTSGTSESSQEQRQQQLASTSLPELLSKLELAAAGVLPLPAAVAALQAAATALEQQALRSCYSFMLDDIISRMADYVPLLDIVSHALRKHGGESFGEFRSTLLGLFGAYAYEQNIMRAANRLITKDAWHKMMELYTGHKVARQSVMGEEGAVGEGREVEHQYGGPAAAVAAAAGVSVLSSVKTVLCAQQLGVLRGGGGGSSVGAGPQLLLLLQEIGGGPRAAAAAAAGEWQGVDGGCEERGGSPGRVHGNGGNHGSSSSSSRSGLFPAAAQEARAMGLGGRAGVFKGSMDLESELVALYRQSGKLTPVLSPVGGRGGDRGHAAAAAGGGSGGSGGRQAGGEVGAGGDSAAAAGAGGMEAPGAAAAAAADFDIDELLQWSKAQL